MGFNGRDVTNESPELTSMDGQGVTRDEGFELVSQLQDRAKRVLSRRAARTQHSQVIAGRYDEGGQLSGHLWRSRFVKLLLKCDGSIHSPANFQTDSSQSVDNVDSEEVLVVCHKGDDICQFGDLVLLEHLTYAQDADTAADFVVSKAGF